MRWPLRYQILLPFGAAMLAIVLLTSILGAYLAARNSQRQIEAQLQGIAETLRQSSFPLTDAVLRQTRGLSGAEFVFLDESGRPLAATIDMIDSKRLPSVSPPVERFKLTQPIDIGGEAFFHGAIPIGASPTQRPQGVLHVLYPQRQLREARREAAFPPLAIGSVLLAIVVAMSIAIANRMSRPIVALEHQLSRLVEGDFQSIPLPKHNDEIRDLVGSVNLLADQLDELHRAIKRAERLSLLGQLSGGLAHQLRNSVAGARIALQLHQRECHTIDPDSLEVALRQLRLTESHLQRFLAVGRPAPPKREPCELAALVADVAALVAPACKHHHVNFEVDACDDGVACPADREQLRQLLLNLVLNAVEAATPGGWVRVSYAAGAERVTLRVTDSGTGPTDELAERLFEPFATGKPEGIGLGLAVARQIASAHNGSIRLQSGRPTCFEVELPMSADGAAPTEMIHELAPLSPSPFGRGSG